MRALRSRRPRPLRPSGPRGAGGWTMTRVRYPAKDERLGDLTLQYRAAAGPYRGAGFGRHRRRGSAEPGALSHAGSVAASSAASDAPFAATVRSNARKEGVVSGVGARRPRSGSAMPVDVSVHGLNEFRRTRRAGRARQREALSISLALFRERTRASFVGWKPRRGDDEAAAGPFSRSMTASRAWSASTSPRGSDSSCLSSRAARDRDKAQPLNAPPTITAGDALANDHPPVSRGSFHALCSAWPRAK